MKWEHQGVQATLLRPDCSCCCSSCFRLLDEVCPWLLPLLTAAPAEVAPTRPATTRCGRGSSMSQQQGPTSLLLPGPHPFFFSATSLWWSSSLSFFLI